MLIPEEFQEEALRTLAMLACAHNEDNWEIQVNGFTEFVEYHDNVSWEAGNSATTLLTQIAEAAALEAKFQESD